jgi:hypothetical protein
MNGEVSMSLEVTLLSLQRFLHWALGIDGRQRVAIARTPANFLR